MTGPLDITYSAAEIARVEKSSGAPADAMPMACCAGCGLPYTDPAFCDLVVPNDVWRQMAPDGGLLCPNCMCKRAHSLGLDCVSAQFTSGPFASHRALAHPADAMPLVDALQKAAQQFRFYEKEHRAKADATPSHPNAEGLYIERHQKADANMRLAEICEQAIAAWNRRPPVSEAAVERIEALIDERIAGANKAITTGYGTAANRLAHGARRDELHWLKANMRAALAAASRSP